MIEENIGVEFYPEETEITVQYKQINEQVKNSLKYWNSTETNLRIMNYNLIVKQKIN